MQNINSLPYTANINNTASCAANLLSAPFHNNRDIDRNVLDLLSNFIN